MLRGVPGRLDRAGEPQARQPARRGRARVLKRRQDGPLGVEPNSEPDRRAEEAPARRALEADEASVGQTQTEAEAAALPGVTIGLRGQGQTGLAFVVLRDRG